MKKGLVLLILGFIFLCSFVVEDLLAEKILAEVGPYKLHKEDLEDLMKGDPQVRELLKVKPELKPQIQKNLLERWLNITLLSLAAREEKLNENPEIKRKLLEAENLILAESYLQKRLSKISIKEEEMRNYYEKNKEKYSEPERVHLKHILIFVPEGADKQTKEKALNRAKQIKAQLLKGVKFEELAKLHSDDTASREKGGDLGVLRKGETLPEFEEKVFKLKVGEISDPISSPYGYHIVKVIKKLPPTTLPYEKVKDEVREDLKREKERALLEKEIEELKQKFSPKIY